MQDGMKGNPEESLRRALAEFADETSSGLASSRVRLALRREVRAKARRRWVLASLATAAALAAIALGVTVRRAPLAEPALPRTAALEPRAAASSIAPAPAAAAPPAALGAGAGAASPRGRSATTAARIPVRPAPRPAKRGEPANGDWRKGEMVLSPWYYNTALPPSARSVLVRSEVDARTAMRFGIVSAGDTAPVEILFGEDGLPRAMRFVRRLPMQSN